MHHRRTPFLVWLLLPVLALLALTAILWFFERAHAWANNWLPNFIAEWTGILIAVGLVEWRRGREREAQLRPLRIYCYEQILRYLDNVGLNAASYLERFVVAAPALENPGDGAEALRAIDAALARDGSMPDTNVRRNWLEMLRGRAATIDELCARHQPFIPEPVIAPVLGVVNTMRSCAEMFGESDLVVTSNYVPVGDAFERAHAAVTRALDDARGRARGRRTEDGRRGP
jgi:hypothetical protein